MEPNQYAILFDDYLEDLFPYPADMIAKACKDYRHNPDNRFFPTSAQLLALVNKQWQPLMRRKRAIEKLLAEIDKPKEIEAPRPTESDFAKLVQDLRAGMSA